MRNILIALLLSPLLVACASLDELKRVEPKGSPFAIALSKEYRAFSESEADQYDWADSQYFAEKGLKAAYGKVLEPEPLEAWDLPPDMLPRMKNAREQLMAALNTDNIANKPKEAAHAQFLFDCWVEQQEENWQDTDIASCRDEFYEVLDKLTKPEEEKPAPAKGGGFTPTQNPSEQISTSYVIFFDPNSTAITKDGGSVVDDVFNELADDTDYVIRLDGHTDRSGNAAFNKELSRRRAVAVQNSLTKRGLSKGKFNITAYGEEMPLIQTPDGVKEKANRRVEIFINE